MEVIEDNGKNGGNTMSVVICGFSGIGKSSAAEALANSGKLIFDLESSVYSHNANGSFNDSFPQNYIDALEACIETDQGDYYLLSCHQSVRDELKKRGIKYILIRPERSCRNEYVKRWLNRGNTAEFITNMYSKWDEMIDSCIEDKVPTVVLSENEYLSDVIFSDSKPKKRLNG